MTPSASAGFSIRLRPHRVRARHSAFTLIELLLVALVILVLTLAIWAPDRRRKQRARQVQCMSNLQHITVGCIVWQEAHGGALPWQVSVTNGGTLEYLATGGALAQYEHLSNDMKAPEILTCPADDAREPAHHEARPTGENLIRPVRACSRTAALTRTFHRVVGPRGENLTRFSG